VHVDYGAIHGGTVGYYNDIVKMDREFGHFLAALNKHPHLFGNAITIFTSDHGGATFGKYTAYEHGLRVPFFMQVHGYGLTADAAARRVDHLASFVDLVPTLIDVAGGARYTGKGGTLDGRSFWPAIKAAGTAGSAPAAPTHAYVFGVASARGIRCAKTPFPSRSVSDGTFKFIRNFNHKYKAQVPMFHLLMRERTRQEYKAELALNRPNAKWMELLECRPPAELYNVAQDPYELNNLANWTHPSPREVQMLRVLEDWMVEQGDGDPVAAELAQSENRNNKDQDYCSNVAVRHDSRANRCPDVYSGVYSTYLNNYPLWTPSPQATGSAAVCVP